jgi:copper chaperone
MDAAQPALPEPAMIELTLPTMTCNHCVQTVTRTVAQVDPQAKTEVDLPAHRVRIESARPVEAFAAALAEEGYAPA